MKKSLLSSMLIVSLLASIAPLGSAMANDEAEVMNPQEIDGNILVGGSNISVEEDIATNLMGPTNFTTLVSAVVEAELAETLMGEGPFTVFAPYNSAFEKISTEDLNALLADKEMLTEVLTYHVVSGTYSSVDLKDGLELTTLNGERIMFSYYNDTWYVNNAAISMVDMYSNNGVIHSIKSVLMPQPNYKDRVEMGIEIRSMLDDKYEARVEKVVKKYVAATKKYNAERQAMLQERFVFLLDLYIDKFRNDSTKKYMLELLKIEVLNSKENTLRSMNIVENAMVGDEYMTFLTALKAADLEEVLQQDGPFTVFVPTNAAFDKLPDELLERLLLESNKDTLQETLKYHVVSGVYLAEDIMDGTELTTLQGTKITFGIDSGVVSINGQSDVQSTNMVASNGVIHTIDSVLLLGQ